MSMGRSVKKGPYVQESLYKKVIELNLDVVHDSFTQINLFWTSKQSYINTFSYKSQEYFEVQSIKFIAAEDNREHAFVQTTKLQPVVAIFNDLQSVV